jgi:hypothetical protein
VKPIADALLTRADELLAFADRVIATSQSGSFATSWVDETLFRELRASALTFLVATFGDDHSLSRDFDKQVESACPSDSEAAKGILAAARSEISRGWLTTVRGIVSAEIFSDFLAMAEYLLDQSYKDPAAVLIGGVLEEHLRQLCQQYKISTTTQQGSNPTPRKADALNGDLAKAGAYSKLDQKGVTHWLDLRNKAAHAKYGEYTKEQVVVMCQGVADFMARTSP